MQDVGYFVGIIVATINVAEKYTKGNRVAMTVAVFAVCVPIRQCFGIDHLTLSHLGLVGQVVTFNGLVFWLAWRKDKQERYRGTKDRDDGTGGWVSI